MAVTAIATTTSMRVKPPVVDRGGAVMDRDLDIATCAPCYSQDLMSSAVPSALSGPDELMSAPSGSF